MISLVMSGPSKRTHDELVLAFFDVSRAHFHSPAQRLLVVRTLKEDSSCEGLAVLLKAMYGTKDAGACFDTKCEEVMRSLGFEIGTFSPCLYHHPGTGLKVFRHGDDFITCGSRAQAREFHESAGRHLLLKHVATLGPSSALGDSQEVRCLNRIIRWARPPYSSTEEHIEYEPDPRHVEIVIANMGLSTTSKGLSSPGAREEASADTRTRLSESDRTAYRSNVMRLAYLALDRVDLQFCTKELAKQMQAPCSADYDALKRVCRYLVSHPRVVQHFGRQHLLPSHIVVHTDSNFAGFLRTREHEFGEYLLRCTLGQVDCYDPGCACIQQRRGRVLCECEGSRWRTRGRSDATRPGSANRQ